MDATPAQKLADLLESAPSDDRRAITAWLLERQQEPAVEPMAVDLLGRTGTTPIGPLHRLGQAMLAGRAADRITGEWLSTQHVERLRGSLTPGRDSQLVTLRLPADRHAELRRWCTEHDFSMAAVIRGLVEEFLEGRGTPEPEPDPA
jgi:hypothetical protein